MVQGVILYKGDYGWEAFWSIGVSLYTSWLPPLLKSLCTETTYVEQTIKLTAKKRTYIPVNTDLANKGKHKKVKQLWIQSEDSSVGKHYVGFN